MSNVEPNVKPSGRSHTLRMAGTGDFERWDKYECIQCQRTFDIHRSNFGNESEAVPKDCEGRPKPGPVQP